LLVPFLEVARARPIDHAPALAQRSPGGGPPVDPITYSARFKELAVVFFPIGLIAKDPSRSAPRKKLRQLRDIGDCGSGRYYGVDEAARDS